MRGHPLGAGPALPRGLPLALPPGMGEGGWYLLHGTLVRRGGDYDARLYFDRGQGWTEDAWLPVPASAKGLVSELLLLPAGVRQLALDPGAQADVQAGSLDLVPVTGWQRRLRMLRRVLPQLWLLPRKRRERVGLTLRGMLRDLGAAYESTSRLRAHGAAPDYQQWIQAFDSLTQADRGRIARQVAGWKGAPFFHVLLGPGKEDAVRRSAASLDAQLFRGFESAHAASDEALGGFRQALVRVPGHWVVLLPAGDVLAPHALYWMAAEILAHPHAAVVYADEDALDGNGRRQRHCFKPDWSWSYARSAAFVGDAVALRADAFVQGGGPRPEDCCHGSYDALLRTLDAIGPEAGAAVRHIPAVLLHRGAERPDRPHAAWAMAAVRSHLARRGIAADVQPQAGGTWRVRYPLPASPPLVSIIVPTRDALALTRQCLDSVRTCTRYPRYEILLVDNQSTDPETLAWMREQAQHAGTRLLHYDRPFNYSAINNMAVRQARGELICLLNNDTQVTQPGWLEEMVAELLQPGVDVVGAKLLYPDGRVQHAGDILGVGGIANHAHAWLGADEPGYWGRALTVQEYCAVTAACLLTRRDRFLGLGGLDEANLPVAFNDVDYCLRVREAGGRVVWTPHAELIHHESVSRGKDLSRAKRRRARREAAYMRRRWREAVAQDPFYNPNLNRGRADFSLDPAPVVPRPWEGR